MKRQWPTISPASPTGNISSSLPSIASCCPGQGRPTEAVLVRRSSGDRIVTSPSVSPIQFDELAGASGRASSCLRPTESGEPQHMQASRLDRSNLSNSGCSSSFWNCRGTIVACVARCFSIVARQSSTSNRRETTSVPPAKNVASMPTHTMFENRPRLQSVRAPAVVAQRDGHVAAPGFAACMVMHDTLG